METASRYVVGIDLGTTNSALAYVDTALPVKERGVKVLAIPQLVAPGEIAELPVLPSFVYLPESHDAVPETLMLPWHAEPPDVVVGTYARDMAPQAPAKVVASAKSWLCYDGIDRYGEVLPWSRESVPRRISPVRAAGLFLEHLREAWNHAMARDDEAARLENQQLIVTVPASFDAVARELTVEAARCAGLAPRLLEEPQAAFYAWLEQQGESWRDLVGEGDVILVCDIGGGTTDFSLIAVSDVQGQLELQRIAVGEHTLLGGDNMDLTLAFGMSAKVKQTRGIELDAVQLVALTHACRAAKEKAGAGAEGAQTLTILGRGSGVVGGTLTIEITPEEMADLLIEGFFPPCGVDQAPTERRKAGLRTFGLDYSSDPAVTRHLAGFLGKHSFRDAEGCPLLPTAIFFNGGVTKSSIFQQRVSDVLNSWNTVQGRELRVLTQSDPDLSVARGAAWYGWIQREGGVRIKAGSARSYYLGVESSLPAVPGFAPPLEALCVVNFGLEEGSSVDIAADGLGLVVGEPTEFRVFSSTSRPGDQVGDRLTCWDADEVQELPPVTAELPIEEGAAAPIGTMVPVRLHADLTEIGTLQLWCHDCRGSGKWRLDFELRGNPLNEVQA